MSETQTVTETPYAEAMRLHEARLPQTTEQQMLRVRVGIKRQQVERFLSGRDLERIGLADKRVNEVSHVEAAHAIIARGGWPTDHGFDLLDMIGQPELKAAFVGEKLPEWYTPEQRAERTAYLLVPGGHKR